jgi:hypothetical protein
VIRYLRLYAHFLRFSFSRAMQFRFDFFFRIGMDTLWYAHHLAFFWLLYRHTPLLGGWTLEQMYVFAGGVFLMDAIQMTMDGEQHLDAADLREQGGPGLLLCPAGLVAVLPEPAGFRGELVHQPADGHRPVFVGPGPLSRAAGRRVDRGVRGLLLLGDAAPLLDAHDLHHPVFWLHTSGGLREMFWSLDRYNTQRPHGHLHGLGAAVLSPLLPFALIVSYRHRRSSTG